MGKIILAVIVTGGVIGAIVIAWLAGTALGLRTNLDTRLQKLGLNRNSAKLYARAVKILNRLHQVGDLDGALAGDALSPETKKLVGDWLADYKEEISK